jgi:hypothetical protein
MSKALHCDAIRSSHRRDGHHDARLLSIQSGSGGVQKSGCGFVPNALAGPATLWDLQNRNGRGQPGRVERHDDQNLFVPD